MNDRYGRDFGGRDRGGWDERERDERHVGGREGDDGRFGGRGRDDGRDERRFGPRDEQRERYYAGDWDRERFYHAPEYRRDENYGWARDREDATERGYGRSDLRDRQFASAYGTGAGSQYGSGTREYRSRGYEDRYGSGEDRWGYRPQQHTLRGIGSPYDTENQRSGGAAFEGWGRHPNRGGFFGKGPRGYVRSDERIREDVCDRLSFDDELDASDITVTVAKGEVTLEGTVSDRHSKRRAEDISESVNGVSEVHNRLRSNKGLAQEVEDKLMGHEQESSGHAGSGTRNSPAGTARPNNH